MYIAYQKIETMKDNLCKYGMCGVVVARRLVAPEVGVQFSSLTP